MDFFCKGLNLAIEIDGSQSHDTKVREDEERQRSLELVGIKVLRLRDRDVRYNLEGVQEVIK